MIFPYACAMPSVMASDGESKQKNHKISKSELEEQYELMELQYKKMLEYQLTLESKFKQEWFREIEPGVYELNVPVDEVANVNTEDILYLKSSLEQVKFLVDNGFTFYDAETDEFYVTNQDQLFITQDGINALQYKYFSVFGVKFYTAVVLYLDNSNTLELVDNLTIGGGALWFASVRLGLFAVIAGSGMVVYSGVIGKVNRIGGYNGVILTMYHTPTLYPTAPSSFTAPPLVVAQ